MNAGVALNAGGMATVELTDLVVAVIALITAAVIAAALVRAFLRSLLRVLPPRRPPGPGTEEKPGG